MLLGLSSAQSSSLASYCPSSCPSRCRRSSPVEGRRNGGAMRIAYITAGAGGMFCGSCLHDNTLAAALIRQGHDALLIPTYTPLRTDEPDVSCKRVFLGGINVYLQEKIGLFRHTPWFVDRLFDARPLL